MQVINEIKKVYLGQIVKKMFLIGLQYCNRLDNNERMLYNTRFRKYVFITILWNATSINTFLMPHVQVN